MRAAGRQEALGPKRELDNSSGAKYRAMFALRCHRVLDPIENDVRERFSDVNTVSEMRSITEANTELYPSISAMRMQYSPRCRP